MTWTTFLLAQHYFGRKVVMSGGSEQPHQGHWRGGDRDRSSTMVCPIRWQARLMRKPWSSFFSALLERGGWFAEGHRPCVFGACRCKPVQERLKLFKIEFFLELLKRMLTDPVPSDSSGHVLDRRVSRQVREAVSPLPDRAMLAEEPDFHTGRVLRSVRSMPCR